MQSTVNVLVTGAAGQIGYALLPRLLSGEVFGPDTRIHLRLVEVPQAAARLEGVVMELKDCAFPLVDDICAGSDMDAAAVDADWALLVGSVPRGIVYKGKELKERSDLLKINGEIFVGQGRAIGRHARADCKVLVVGNPANTNCLIGHHHAAAPGQVWMAMMALDANRARSMLAERAGCRVEDVKRMIIWGNHSPTMYPDAANARIGQLSAAEAVADQSWLKGDFLTSVQQRGKAVIDARGASSALSAASAALDTVRTVHRGTAPGDCLSTALISRGEYGTSQGLCCGFPVEVRDGGLRIIPNLELDADGREKFDRSLDELEQEREAVAHLLD